MKNEVPQTEPVLLVWEEYKEYTFGGFCTQRGFRWVGRPLNVLLPKRDGSGDLPFVTFSCSRRLALLGAADAIFFCAPWKLFAGSIGSWWLDT